MPTIENMNTLSKDEDEVIIRTIESYNSLINKAVLLYVPQSNQVKPTLAKSKSILSQSKTVLRSSTLPSTELATVKNFADLSKWSLKAVDRLVIELASHKIIGTETNDTELIKISEEILSWEFLKSLEVNLYSNGITDEGLLIFSENIGKLTKLQVIGFDFSKTKITDTGIENLVFHLKNLKKITSFSLELAWCEIENVTLMALSDLLDELGDLKRFKLSLYKTHISQVGLQYLSEKLGKLPHLNKVEFWMNQKLKNECEKDIISKIKKKNKECLLNMMWT